MYFVARFMQTFNKLKVKLWNSTKNINVLHYCFVAQVAQLHALQLQRASLLLSLPSAGFLQVSQSKLKACQDFLRCTYFTSNTEPYAVQRILTGNAGVRAEWVANGYKVNRKVLKLKEKKKIIGHLYFVFLFKNDHFKILEVNKCTI